jgi:cell division protein FtsQ
LTFVFFVALTRLLQDPEPRLEAIRWSKKMAVEPMEEFKEMAPREASAALRRRGSGRWKRKFRAVGLLGLLVGLIVLTVRFVLYSPYFQVTSSRLQGAKFVTPGDVAEKFSSDKGKSILLVPLDRRRRQIERIPWVESALVRRILPNELAVTVRERTPVAFLRKSSGLALVDEEGVILEPPPGASFQFPVVSGLAEDEPAAARRTKMHLFASLMKDLERGGLRTADVISEVDLQDSADARVVIAEPSGAVLVHLGQENFLARYLLYIGHIGEWKQKYPNIQSVDLRYERQVVINSEPQKDLKTQRGSAKTGNRQQPAASGSH